MTTLPISKRTLSVFVFSFLFAYVLAFLFEGQVLYRLLDAAKVTASPFILAAIVAHFFGQFTCGFFCKSPGAAKRVMLGGMVFCLLITSSFFLVSPVCWMVALIAGGYEAGCAVAAWGYFLKAYTPKNERIHACADVLIYSNILMIAINVVAINLSAKAGLTLSMLCLACGIALIWTLPADDRTAGEAEPIRPISNIRKPMGVLFLFVAIITVNSGLMYQVINPAFARLSSLASWYWAAPYIAALIIMRNLPMRMNRPVFLYIGMGMIMCAFLFFMLLSRNTVDYLIIDTLMLGACYCAAT